MTIERSQYPHRVSQCILDVIAINDMEQMVDFPTRWDATLDLILTSHPSCSARCKPLPSLGKSDHDIVLYDTTLTPLRPKPPKRKLYLWRKADVEGIREDLREYAAEVNTNSELTASVNSFWDSFRERVTTVMEKHIPSKTTPRRNSNLWINTDIRRAIRRKQRAHKKARDTGKKRDKDRYKRLQAEVRLDIKRANST